MHSEEESLSGQRLSKYHSWRIADISWIFFEKNKKQTSPTSSHGGFSSKNKLQHIQLSDTTGTSNSTGLYGQIKNSFKNLK